MGTLMLGAQAAVTGGLTSAPPDLARAALITRAARTPEERAQAFRFVMERRAEYREWVTVTQRKWQARARTQARARHHDSVSIREHYVRCAQ